MDTYRIAHFGTLIISVGFGNNSTYNNDLEAEKLLKKELIRLLK